jgi:hypothetical protein
VPFLVRISSKYFEWAVSTRESTSRLWRDNAGQFDWQGSEINMTLFAFMQAEGIPSVLLREAYVMALGFVRGLKAGDRIS